MESQGRCQPRHHLEGPCGPFAPLGEDGQGGQHGPKEWKGVLRCELLPKEADVCQQLTRRLQYGGQK